MTNVRQLLPIPLPAIYGGTGGTGGVPAAANPTATAGPVAVNGTATTFLRSDGAPAIQLATNAQKGLVQVDGTTITATAGVISATASVSGANPTATAGPTAVNGSAATFMRSDAAPAIQKASNSVFGIVEVDNTTITASSGVISAVAITPTLIGFEVNNAADQAISSATQTKVTLGTVVFDTNSWFASSRFTPLKAGYYQINGTVSVADTVAITNAIFNFYKNGVLYNPVGFITGANSAASGNLTASFSTVIRFNGSTDYVELFGFAVGTSPSFRGNATFGLCSMSGYFIGS